jgi:YD repeat-containing protein
MAASRPGRPPVTGATTYTYDSENRLVTVATNSSTTASITYDYDGLRRRVSALLCVHGRITVTTGAASFEKPSFSSVQGLFRLLKQSYWESYCLFL